MENPSLDDFFLKINIKILEKYVYHTGYNIWRLIAEFFTHSKYNEMLHILLRKNEYFSNGLKSKLDYITIPSDFVSCNCVKYIQLPTAIYSRDNYNNIILIPLTNYIIILPTKLNHHIKNDEFLIVISSYLYGNIKLTIKKSNVTYDGVIIFSLNLGSIEEEYEVVIY